jgi:mono/diheme cytochrome c family protein
MYKGLLHTHTLVVTLFLIHYIVKTVLLVGNKNEQLAGYTKKTKVAEMIISFLFLLTGIGMLVMGAQTNTLFFVKIALVVASIPLAVIGFKKGKKPLAILAVVLIFISYGLAEMSKKQKAEVKVDTANIESKLEKGKAVYQSNCISCHGAAGNAMLAGAKDLTITALTPAEVKEVVKNGRGSMQAYPTLSDDELDGIAEYIELMKKK